MDPRVTTTTSALQLQFDMSMQAYEGISKTKDMSEEARKLSEKLRVSREKLGRDSQAAKDIETLEKKIAEFTNGPAQSPGALVPVAQFSLGRLGAAYASMLDLLQDADVAPTTQAVRDSRDLDAALVRNQQVWNTIKTQDLVALNETLKRANLSPIGQ
jgi:hypothetical protein